jgi:hypothetical protein
MCGHLTTTPAAQVPSLQTRRHHAKRIWDVLKPVHARCLLDVEATPYILGMQLIQRNIGVRSRQAGDTLSGMLRGAGRMRGGAHHDHLPMVSWRARDACMAARAGCRCDVPTPGVGRITPIDP